MKTYLERLDSLIQQADAILTRGSQQNIVQAGIEKKEEQQRNIKQAAIKSDRDIMETMFAFTNGDNTGGHQPPSIGMLSDNPQSNIKNAGLRRKQTDIEQMQTCLEFAGLL